MLAAADEKLLLVVNGAISAPLRTVLLGVTCLAGARVLVAWTITLASLALREGRRAATAIVLSAGMAGGLDWLLKHLVARPRPWRVVGALQTAGPLELDASFPSGHSTGAFALAVAVALHWPRAAWPAFGAAVLVALSRLAVGMHYPSDVLGGAVLGAMTTWAVHWGLRERSARSTANAATPE